MYSTQLPQLPGADSDQVEQKSTEETSRPPLVTSEKNNAVSRKPRTKEISSRYKSSITSSLATPTVPSSARRSPSPNVSRSLPVSTPSFPQRARSADSRRPSTPSSPSRLSTPSSPSRPSRPSTPLNNSMQSNGMAEVQISSKRSLGRSSEGLWPSTRTLCVSFQTDTFSLPVTKRERPISHFSDHTLKPSANVAHKEPETPTIQRKATPERKRTPLRGKNTNQSENSKPLENSQARVVDRHMWPTRNSGKASGNAMTRSVDLTDKASKAATLLLQGRGVSALTKTPTSDAVTRGLHQSMSEGRVGIAPSTVARRVSFDGRAEIGMGVVDSTSLRASGGGNSHFTADRPFMMPGLSHDAEVENTDDSGCDSVSDLVSVSSSSNLISQRDIVSSHSSFSSGGSSRWSSLPAANHMNRSQVLHPSMPESKHVSSSRGVSPCLSERASSAPRSSRHQSSPLPGPQRPPSPSKTTLASSPSRGMISPSRTRGTSVPYPSANSVTNYTGCSSSVLNFIADVRKGKKGVTHIEDAHQLRILYNRYLQWRFVNARADGSLSIQKVMAEKLLYDVWNTTSELRDSVTVKRINLQQLRQKIKIYSVLKEQMQYLDDWASLEREHSCSLSGAIEALEAGTLRLPVTAGARADTQTLKDAISSAVDVMKAMCSSLCSLLSKVEGMNGLVSELAQVAAQERAMLDECGDLLATTAAMQVEESSLRTHLIQLNQVAKHGG